MAKSTNESFEKRLERLQAIVAGLEEGSLALEDSVALYKEGLALSRACKEQLDKAAHEISILSKGEVEPFAPTANENED